MAAYIRMNNKFLYQLISYSLYKQHRQYKSTKMSSIGYEKSRFPTLQGQIFDCLICAQVVKAPKQCSGCGNLFCSQCINQQLKKSKQCPNRCQGAEICAMSSKALINIYRELDIKCSKCTKVFKLGDIEKHEDLCGKPRCQFAEFCNGFENNKQDFAPFCSQKCKIFSTIIKCKAQPQTTYTLLLPHATKFIKPNQGVVGSSSVSGPQGGLIALTWSRKQCGENIQVNSDNISVFLKEEAYIFRTIVASQGFTGGRHYWEIHADGRTENQLKIGITGSNAFYFDTAFCDHKFGYAYYGLGQLRHASNATGPQYGKRFKKTGILGVFLNMDKGTLSFCLNGQDFGEAYNDPELKKGPLYPAVALLHCSGCILKGQLPIPPIYSAK